MPVDQSTVRNRLLRRLSGGDFALVAPCLERFSCGAGKLLFTRGTPIDHCFFLDEGIGSLVAVSPEGQRAESGIFGRDGFAPTALVLGADQSAWDCMIQVPDAGWRIAAPALRAAMQASESLHALLLRFAETLAIQTSYTALSNAVHPVDERLARWLLMCHDRIDGNELRLTHEFMALMLAVRRPSVTSALHVLEGYGFIRTERACVTIRDRARLAEFAGDAYGEPEAAYRRLIGPLD